MAYKFQGFDISRHFLHSQGSLWNFLGISWRNLKLYILESLRLVNYENEYWHSNRMKIPKVLDFRISGIRYTVFLRITALTFMYFVHMKCPAFIQAGDYSGLVFNVIFIIVRCLILPLIIRGYSKRAIFMLLGKNAQ